MYMRFNSFVVSLAGVHCASASNTNLRSSIRPHPQFLIQSVRTTHAEEFEEYRATDVKSRDFCQAASTFTNAESVAHPYKTSLELVAKPSFTGARSRVQMLEYIARKDDVRRALGMREVWESTIVDEFNILTKVISGKMESIKQSKGLVGKILSLTAANEPIAHIPQRDGVFSKTAEDEQLATIAENVNPTFDGVGQNSEGNWRARDAHYAAVYEALTTMNKELSDRLQESQTFISDHVQYTIDDGNFKVKWPTDFQFSLDSIKPDFNGTHALELLFPGTESDVLLKYPAEPEGAPPDESEKKVPSEETSTDTPTLGKHLDSYTEAMSVADATALIAQLQKGEALELDGVSPSQALARLTNAMEFLHIRRLGLQDARSALEALITKAHENMELIRDDIQGIVDGVATKLTENEERIQITYNDAKGFPGVKFDEELVSTSNDQDMDNFDTHLKKLAEAKSGDAHASVVPRINYVVNMIRTMHRNLFAFVAAHGGAVMRTPASEVDVSGVRTHLLESPASIATFLETPVATREPVDFETFGTTELTKLEDKARDTAHCMLYGHADLLEVDAKTEGNVEDKLCGSSFTFGKAVLDELEKQYPVVVAPVRGMGPRKKGKRGGFNATDEQDVHPETDIPPPPVRQGRAGGSDEEESQGKSR